MGPDRHLTKSNCAICESTHGPGKQKLLIWIPHFSLNLVFEVQLWLLCSILVLTLPTHQEALLFACIKPTRPSENMVSKYPAAAKGAIKHMMRLNCRHSKILPEYLGYYNDPSYYSGFRCFTSVVFWATLCYSRSHDRHPQLTDL